MTPLDHTKGGSRAGLMEQRSKDLSAVYKNPDILSSKQTDAATDAVSTNNYCNQQVFEIKKTRLIDSLNKKEDLLKYTRRYPNQTAPQKSSPIFNDKRLYGICQEPLLGKSRFHCRFITFAVPFESLRIAICILITCYISFCFGSRKFN